MSPVTVRENVVSVLTIIGGINNSQVVFSPRKGNDLTIVRFVGLSLRTGEENNECGTHEWRKMSFVCR
jgi:hypothetical protein